MRHQAAYSNPVGPICLFTPVSSDLGLSLTGEASGNLFQPCKPSKSIDTCGDNQQCDLSKHRCMCIEGVTELTDSLSCGYVAPTQPESIAVLTDDSGNKVVSIIFFSFKFNRPDISEIISLFAWLRILLSDSYK